MVKGLIIRNVHVKYENPTSSHVETMTKVKKKPRSLGQRLSYVVKGLVKSYTHKNEN